MSTQALAPARPVDLFKASFETLKIDPPNWLKVAAATLLLFIVVGVPGWLIGPTISPIIVPLISIPLGAGLLVLVRDALDQKAFDLPKLFSGFTNTPQLINLLILAVPSVILGVLQVVIVKVGIGILSLPLIALLIAYNAILTLALQRVLFAGRDAITALKESVPATIQNIIPLLVFFALALVAIVLGVLALVVGVLFAIPLVFGSAIRLHDEIFGRSTTFSMPPAAPPPPFVAG
jgi:hypothetical protein